MLSQSAENPGVTLLFKWHFAFFIDYELDCCCCRGERFVCIFCSILNFFFFFFVIGKVLSQQFLIDQHVEIAHFFHIAVLEKIC